jgi:hypothetical protein
VEWEAGCVRQLFGNRLGPVNDNQPSNSPSLAAVTSPSLGCWSPIFPVGIVRGEPIAVQGTGLLSLKTSELSATLGRLPQAGFAELPEIYNGYAGSCTAARPSCRSNGPVKSTLSE